MRTIFMGSPALAVPALEALYRAGHEIICVYTAPPRRSGRSMIKTPVQLCAERLDLPVRYPSGFAAASDQAAFIELNADIALVVAYGRLLPPELLSGPTHGCLNIHASALPRWRGAAPVQRAIMAGDKMIAVQIMRMEQKLDTGPIMLSERLNLSCSDTAGAILSLVGEIGGRLAVEALELVASGRAVFVPQSLEGVIYAAKISAAETRIDWRQSAEKICRQIHGLSPFPGAWCEGPQGERLKILRAALMEAHSRPGEAVDDELGIGCGEGALRLLELQRAGKTALCNADFRRGFPVPAGTILH